jgi:hypothetical protein
VAVPELVDGVRAARILFGLVCCRHGVAERGQKPLVAGDHANDGVEEGEEALS